MPIHDHPEGFKLAADLDRLANDPARRRLRADSILIALAAVERDHPAHSECIAYVFRVKLALERLRAALAGG